MAVDLTHLTPRAAIGILDERTTRDDARLTAVENEQVRQGNRLTRLETKIAAYAALGALLGGAIFDVVSKHLP